MTDVELPPPVIFFVAGGGHQPPPDPPLRVVWVYDDDRIGAGDVEALADHVHDTVRRTAGCEPDVSQIGKVYTAADGALVEVRWAVTGTVLGEDYYPRPVVTVTLPDGSECSAPEGDWGAW